MTYKELLEQPEFAQAVVYVSNDDINHYIKGVYVADTSQVHNLVKSGDLVFVSGAGFQNVKEELTELVTVVNEKKAAGLVVETGPFIEEVPEEAVAKAEEYRLPLLSLSYNISTTCAISETHYAIFRSRERLRDEDYFVQEFLYGDEEKSYLYLNQLNYNRSAQHVVIFFSFDQPGYDEALLHELELAVPINLSMQLFSVCYAVEDGVVVVLELSQKEPLKNIVNRIQSSVQKFLGSLLAGNTISAGVSRIFYGPEEMKKCIEEARKVFQVLRGCQAQSASRYYDEIGIYRFFFEFDDEEQLRSFMLEHLGELMEYDRENHGDYVNTLEIYLDENCNIGETAERMFVHRNTIKYRITRVEEMLDVDLTNANECFNLRFAYKIRNYLGENL